MSEGKIKGYASQQYRSAFLGWFIVNTHIAC